MEFEHLVTAKNMKFDEVEIKILAALMIHKGIRQFDRDLNPLRKRCDQPASARWRVAFQDRSHRDYMNYKAKLFQGLLSKFKVCDMK